MLNEERPTAEMASSAASDCSENPTAELVDGPSRPDHEYHPNCPDTLACLPDTDGRPQHTLPVILRCAILGSPKKRLTIREIYATMEAKYPYYRTAGPTWKVRFVSPLEGMTNLTVPTAISATSPILKPAL